MLLCINKNLYFQLKNVYFIESQNLKLDQFAQKSV